MNNIYDIEISNTYQHFDSQHHENEIQESKSSCEK